MKIDEKTRETLGRFPLYSQDGKGGEAVAVVRLFITGTAATFYILEADTRTGELFGVSNMEREGWTYGYYYLPELEELDLQEGVVHLEADRDFVPTRLADIPEVAAGLSRFWEKGGDGESDTEEEQGGGYRITCASDAYNASHTHRYKGHTVLSYDGATPVKWIHDDGGGYGLTIDEARAKLMSYAREDAENSGEKITHRYFENSYTFDVWTFSIEKI